MKESQQNLGDVGVLYLAGPASSPRPAVVVIPMLGRLGPLPDLAVERWVAAFFARRGFAAVVLKRPFFQWDARAGLDQVDRYLAGMVERAERAAERLARVDGVDAGWVGSLGISFGAVVSALLSRSPRFSAHVVALGGANLGKVLASSRDPLVRSYFQELLTVTGLPREALVARLKEVFVHDPLHAGPAISTDRILTIRAAFDRVVRPCYGKALWAALGRPREVLLPLGHYTALLVLPVLLRIALRFFRSTL